MTAIDPTIPAATPDQAVAAAVQPAPTPPAAPVTEAPGLAAAVPPSARVVQPGRPDKISFDPNGVISIVVAGEPYTLRCPTMPEMEGPRSKWDAVTDKARRAGIVQAQAIRDGEVPPTGGDVDPAWETVDWVVSVISLLADKPFTVPANQYPAWFSHGSLPSKMINHWRAIPED